MVALVLVASLAMTPASFGPATAFTQAMAVTQATTLASATTFSRPTPLVPPPAPALFPYSRRRAQAPPYEIEHAHGFIAGGFSLMTTSSLTNAFLLGGWNLTGGMEFPVRRSWALVPRAHIGGATGTNTGSIHLTRVALDGRIATRGGSYEEAGLGIGLLDSPVSVTDSLFQSHEEQRWHGAPFVQLVAGVRGNPELAKVFMVELITSLGFGAERPGTLEIAAGVEF